MLTLTPEQILSLNGNQVLDIKFYYMMFPNSQSQTTQVWRRLSSKWHPDKHASENDKVFATKVFEHIKQLKDLAETHINAGVWGGDNYKSFSTPTSFLEVSFLKSDDQGGACIRYMGKYYVWSEFTRDNLDLVEQAKKNLKFWSTPLPPEMASDENLYIASRLQTEFRVLENGGVLSILPKDRATLALNHVLEKRKLDPKHVVWIMSRLHSLACLMQIRKVLNLDISPGTILINPKTHGVILEGGWQYSRGIGEKPLAIPARTAKICPSLLVEKKASIKHVLEMIKALGRELLGDIHGVKLRLNPDIPDAFITWAISPAQEDAIEAFKEWEKVKRSSYGTPRWETLTLTETDVY